MSISKGVYFITLERLAIARPILEDANQCTRNRGF